MCISGSTLTSQEEQCLKVIFKTMPVQIPRYQQIQGNKLMHHEDQVITTNVDDYYVALRDLIIT